MRTLLLCLLLVVALAPAARAADSRKDLDAQLAAAEAIDPPDTASAAEICRRILLLDPKDDAIREKRARDLFELGEYKDCQAELDAWARVDKKVPPAATDIAGDLAHARADDDETADAQAVKLWLAYIAMKPREPETYKKIAEIYEQQSDWTELDGILTKLIKVEDSALTRVTRACARLELRHWDDAIADINKANQLDATDDSVKQWLPQFETLEKSLPKIKDLDRKIAAAKKPDAFLLLERGKIFLDIGRDSLALQDADAALKALPGSRRAILQKFKAGAGGDEATEMHVVVAKLDFDDKALFGLGDLDEKIAANPHDAALYTDRARACSDIEQYGLAIDDAREAVKLNPKSADALVELGFAEMKLDHPHDAAREFSRAIELDPKNAIGWRSLGELAMDRADYPDAIENFTKSLDLHQSPLVLQKREECYRNSGHKKEADEDLQLREKLTAHSTPFVNKK
ncbi:MAG TPA: tetratricopeptide repeat protein [Chthoniobacteraceae bacterium]|nr:tetratricopeptide repeat protein [Chthoniobacteraceae bacterium]